MFAQIVCLLLLLLSPINLLVQSTIKNSNTAATTTPAIKPQYQFGQFGSAAGSFNNPAAVAIAADKIYVADCFNNRIQVLDLTGHSIAIYGHAGKQLGEFERPQGIAIANDKIYIADSGNNRIQVLDKQGKAIRTFGDDRAIALNQPIGIAVQADKIYVADSGNNRFVIFNANGKLLASYGEYGSKAGQFDQPLSIAVDEQNSIYLADTNNQRVQKFNQQGELIKVWGIYGSYPGQFNAPVALAYQAGELFVADRWNNRIQVFDRDGNFIYQWAQHPPDNHSGNGWLHQPDSLAISDKLIVVGEAIEARFQIFDREQFKSANTNNVPINSAFARHAEHIAIYRNYLAISLADSDQVLLFDIFLANAAPKFIGKVGGHGNKFGLLDRVGGLTIDSKRGLLYVSDQGNNRIEIYQIATLVNGGSAGSAFVQAFGQRGEGEIQFRAPAGLAVDNDGNLYVCDQLNNRITVYSPDHKLLRQWSIQINSVLAQPFAITLDSTTKRIYLLAKNINSVLVYSLDGQLLTSWSLPNSNPAIVANALTISANNYLLISDCAQQQLLKIDLNGKLLANLGKSGTAAGEFCQLTGVALTSNGNVFVIDSGNHRLQLLTADDKPLTSFDWLQLLKDQRVVRH